MSLSWTDCQALRPICNQAFIQQLMFVDKNHVENVIGALLQEVKVFKAVDNPHTLDFALEVAAQYVDGLYLAFRDQKILFLVSDFVYNSLDTLVQLLKRCSTDHLSLHTTECSESNLFSKVHYASQACRVFTKIVHHNIDMSNMLERLLDIAGVTLETYKRIPCVGYPLIQLILENLESGIIHYFGPTEAEQLFNYLFNFLKYSVTVHSDIRTSCLLADVVSVLFSYLSFPSLKMSFGNRIISLVETLCNGKLFHEPCCAFGQEDLYEVLLKLTTPLFQDPYQELSSLSNSSIYRILYWQTVRDYPLCNRKKNYEMKIPNMEILRKRPRNNELANSFKVSNISAEYLSRLVSYTEEELATLEAQRYEIGVLVVVRKLAMVGTSMKYLKQNLKETNDLLYQLIFKYRSLVSSVFQILLDRVDPCSSRETALSLSFLKDLLITLDSLFFVSEDEHAKHITFPVLEMGLKVFNHRTWDEIGNAESICRQFTDICTSQLLSCQVTDRKPALDFINFVISWCCNGSLSTNISFLDEMRFLILEKCLLFIRQLSEQDVALYSSSLSNLQLDSLMTFLSRCNVEWNDSDTSIADIVRSRYLFYLIVTEVLALHVRFSQLVSLKAKFCVLDILDSLEKSWNSFFDTWSFGLNDWEDTCCDNLIRKYILAVVKFCVEVSESHQSQNEENRRLLSRNLQYCLYVALIVGMEPDTSEYIHKAVNILAYLDCFSSNSVSFGPLKDIRCFSCWRNSTCTRLRSLEMSFQCSGLCNLVTLLISEKFMQSEHFSLLVWGRLVSYLLKCVWNNNYCRCDDSASFHMECLTVILLDSLISWSSPKLLQDLSYFPRSTIDFESAVKLSIESRESSELESFEVLFHIASQHSLIRMSCEKVVPWFLRLFRDRLAVIGFHRLVNDPSEIYGWQSLFQSSTKELWNCIASNVLRILLVKNDFQSAEFLANQCGRSLDLLIKENLGSILATYLYQRTILEANRTIPSVDESLVRLETCLEFIRKSIDCASCAQLFTICKISATKFLVQRLCKPAPERISLEKCLDYLAKLTGHNSSCGLISECFLALMDDLNQRIFLRLKHSLLARARSLRCLQRLFTFVSSEMHLFIPKILASLKLILELEDELIPVGIDAWVSFLNNLDPLHAGSHILTILSVLKPFVPSFPEQLGQCLARLVSQCDINLFLIIDESFLPVELVSQPSFSEFFKNWRLVRQNLSLQQQIDMLVEFIESPEVATVKYAVLSRLHKLITANRKQIIRDLTRDIHLRSSVNAIITSLFKSLQNFDRNCCFVAADILGDLGAIDPLFLSGEDSHGNSRQHISCGVSMSDKRIDNLESFLQVLLCQYLIPCLKEGEKSGTGLHQNVIGFALQELIRIYMIECHQPAESISSNDLQAFSSSKLYLSLAKDYQDLLVPYIHSSYSVVQTGHKKEPMKLVEMLDSKSVGVDVLDIWISNLCILLVDTQCFLATQSPLSRVLQVCRNVYRLHPQNARFAFPYILRQFLDNFSDHETEPTVLEFIDSEISCALSQGSIFTSWVLGLVEEYREIEKNFTEKDKVFRLETICSRLNSFGGEYSCLQRNVLYKFLKNLNDVDLAKAALKIGSCHRAIFYMEEHLQNSIQCGNLDDAASFGRLLQHAYRWIGDKDSLLGLLALQKKKLSKPLSLQEKILEAESLENMDEVNALYNEALSSKMFTGLEVSYVKHLLALNLTENAKYYASKFSSNLQGIKQEQMRALHCAAAWRLSEWSEMDSIDSYPRISGDEIGEVCLGTYLNSLSSHSLTTQVRNLTKERIVRSMTDPSLGTYGKSYKFCVYLSILRELEWVNEISSNPESCVDSEKLDNLYQELALRLERTVPEVEVREPIVEARRVCYKLFGYDYYVVHSMMELAKLQKENGNLHAAYLNVIRSENMLYSLDPNNKDLALLSEIEMEKADIYRNKGNLFSAVETLEKVVQSLESHTQEQMQGKLFRMETQLARALVALGNVSEVSHTCTTEVVASYYKKAVNVASNFQDGFYYLARFYDRMLQESTCSIIECGEKQNKQLSPLDKNSTQNMVEFLSVALENYTRTMELGGKYIFESLPRLLTLWFNFEQQSCSLEKSMSVSNFEGNIANVRSIIQRAFDTLPLWQWTTCISQILSRVSHPSAYVRQSLVHLTARLTVSYCSRMIWYLAPVLNGKNSVRRQTGEKIVSAAEELGGKNVSDTLRYGFAFIQELSKICLQSTPKQVKKLSFSSNFNAFKKMLPCKQVVIPTKRAIMISYDESLTDRNDSLESTEWNPWNEDLPTVYGVEDDIVLMNSLMKPKRICLLGSDGKQYHFLCKREDSGDMRKDSRLMEFASVINRLLRNNQQSRSRQLTLRTYAVLPLSEECGVIEWISNLAPLRGIVFHLYHIFGIPISLGEIKEQYEKRTCTNLEFYRNWLLNRFPTLLRHFFVACFPEPSDWFLAKKRFTYSCAVWSMIGYIVGLGDRHGENILIDMASGECVHVDFACMFEKGLTLKVPEVVPFRLTPNMLDAMGPTGYEGSFRVASQITMSIARANRDGLMSVLETFLYDPLVEWERNSNVKYRNSKDKENVPVEKAAMRPNAHALKARQTIDEKLQGIVKDSRLPLSIQGQVQRLILEATNEENLANMYIWWMAWV